MKTANEHDERLTELLRAHGQRVTPQRLAIHRALRANGGHMTAETVRDSLGRELPGSTSLPTIYSTLDLLVDFGLASRIEGWSGATLYDARVDHHHHAVCRGCGRVQDLDADIDPTPLVDEARDTGFTPVGSRIVVTGYCDDCVSTPNEHTPYDARTAR